MPGLIFLLIIVALAIWVIASYNRLVSLRNQVANGWRQIDVQLKRRHDLIPNLVNAVRGSMDFERDTLTAVMDARAKALAATGPADAAQKEGDLSRAVGRLFAVAENYPTLKSNDNVKMLQEELAATENKVGFARQFYNDITTQFNTAQQVFPTALFATMFGFKPAELFEITEATDRDVPVVDFDPALNLYEQQRANRRKTWIIMAAFAGFLFLLGLGFDTLYIGDLGGVVPIGSLLALLVGSVGAAASYFTGDRAVLLSSGARPVEELEAQAADPERLTLRQLENVVDEMAIAAGIPRPRVYVVPDDDPNAFATGRGPGYASIAVTRGLLQALDREELQGVIAHEMSHIRNLDTRVMTVVAALVGAVALIADWSRRGMWWGGGRRRDDDREGGGGLAGVIFFVIWIAAIIVAPLVAQMLAMMVSRKREYLADASGAELTRNPLGLARALEKIDSAVEPTRAINSGSAHLCIADPLGRPMNAREEGFWSNLFASHPPMSQRIAALRQMAYQHGGR